MKAWNYNLNINRDKLISLMITFVIISLLYLLMAYIKLPKNRRSQQIEIDQIIDTDLFEEKIKQIQPNEKDHLTSDRKEETKPKSNTPKYPGPVNKINLSEINPNLRKKIGIPKDLIPEFNEDTPPKITNLIKSKSNNAIGKRLDFLQNRKISPRGTEIPLGGKTGTNYNSGLEIKSSSSDVGNDYSFGNNGVENHLGVPEGHGGNDRQIFELGYMPPKTSISHELKEIIRWICNHHVTLPQYINSNLQKKRDDKTAKVQFQIKDTKYDMFLRATPVLGDEEIAFAICHGDSFGLLIDQGADQKNDQLRIGIINRNKGKIVGFISKYSANFDLSSHYSRVFWAWWQNQKNR